MLSVGAVSAGQELGPVVVDVDRSRLVAYAAASGDHNRIHWDERFARSVGLPDVIAHGMWTMGAACALVCDWVGDPGAVLASNRIHDTLMQGPIDKIELPHGYTCSGHPLACAAGLATLDVYEKEGLFERAAGLESYWGEAAHALKELPGVLDIRTIGLLAAIDLEPLPDKPSRRAYDCHLNCMNAGVMVRSTGDSMVLSPPLTVEKSEIDQMFGVVADALKRNS